MAGVLKPPKALSFAVTPHKLSICILAQVYAPAAQTSLPFPFNSVSQHNRLGLFLLSLSKSCEDIFEPKFDELIAQLREIDGVLNHWLSDHLTARLSAIVSPDDLFGFFSELRGILGGSDTNVMDDDQTILDPSSNLGVFVRRCLLAFNLLSFEGVCHLLTNLDIYRKESVSGYPPYELSHLDDSSNDMEASTEYDNIELENVLGSNPTHKGINKIGDVNSTRSSCDEYAGTEPPGGKFLRTNWQIQGYLLEQADTIEKHGSTFPFSDFESLLKQLQKLAPELHRVHFLRYLNNLYHDDYPVALENLQRYFDYSAGTEGFDYASTSSSDQSSFGRYGIALLFLGMMHFHFGHPEQALEVLTEAVRVSQQLSDDTCLAYTLAAICNLLSEISMSNATGLIGSSYSPVASTGTSLSVQQQLFVLLKRSLKRAESLKLKRLVASNHIAMAKFDLTNVQRPLLSFGPKASMKLKTSPINVCKELRLSSHLMNEFGDEIPTVTIDGSLCTTWLRNLSKPVGSLVFSPENDARSSSDAVRFCAHTSTVPHSVLQLLGSSYLVQATAWEIYGSAPLARINSLVFATCFADSSSSADAALAYSKLIEYLAAFKGYKEAFAALQIAELKFLCISKSRIQLVKLQLLHERALHRGKLKLAQKFCDELGTLASSVTGVDMELKTEANVRHARTLLVENQFSQAAAVAHSLFRMCYKSNLHIRNATVLLLLAEIHKRSGNAVLGVPYALASLSFCQSFNLDLLKASATLTLAELWLSVGSSHAKRSLSHLHSAFPVLLGHGGLELRSRAWIVEAKCHLADASFSVSEEPELVLEPLRQASEALELLEYHELAAESFYLMAIVYDKLGHLEKREEAAGFFRKHITALENALDPEDPMYSSTI